MTLRVVSLHAPHPLSGVSVWGARLASCGLLNTDFIPLVAGEAWEIERIRGEFPGHPQWLEWPVDPVARLMLLRDALRRLDAQVIIPNDSPLGFAAAALDRHRGLRSVGVAHADDLGYEELFERAARIVDAAWAVSDGCRDRIARSVHRRIPVIPCGLLVPPDPGPLPHGPPLRLLYSGRLDNAYKRSTDLVPLADSLERAGAHFEITVAGDGPIREQIMRAASRHVESGRLSPVGVVPHDRMGRLIRAHHALVMTSRSEGWPIAAMEAMAAGRPIAITRGCGGACALVRDGVEGIVVPIGDARSMAEKIAAWWTDRRRIGAMGTAAHEAAARVLDLRRLARAYDEVFASAHGSPTASPASLSDRWASILGLLELAGPCDPRALARLAEEWAREVGVPVRSLRTVLPGLSTIPQRRMLHAVQRLRAQGNARIALYGAGRHTRKIAPVLAALPEVVAILDDRAGIPGGPPARLYGRPVIRPESADVQAVVMSSEEHEQEMAARAAALGFRVERLYTDVLG